MGLGKTAAGSAVATGEEAETSAMVAVASRACTKKLRERSRSEAGRRVVIENSISIRRVSIRSDSPGGTQAAGFIAIKPERSVVARLDWAELCPTSVRTCGAPNENHARIA
jgi:hypothetical protein